MLRTALQPRWLALTAVLVVVVVAFGILGRWQLSLAQDEQKEKVLTEQAAMDATPLSQVVAPHAAFPEQGSGRPVRATGGYVSDLQFVVPDRILAGRTGFWVVTPLRTGDGALLPVLRGWVADPEEAGTPDTGTRTVTGTLAPGESPGFVPGLPAGQRGSIDLAVLANEWPGELYNAFIFATHEDPQVSEGSVRPVPPPSLSTPGVDWRNLGYALQWWVFAGFAVYMYFRFLKEAARAPRPTSVRSASTVVS